jgi:hypothetical protein
MLRNRRYPVNQAGSCHRHYTFAYSNRYNSVTRSDQGHEVTLVDEEWDSRKLARPNGTTVVHRRGRDDHRCSPAPRTDPYERVYEYRSYLPA